MSVVSSLLCGAPSLRGTANPTYVYGARHGSGPVSTQSTTVSPIGGVSPYSYAWSFSSGDSGFSASAATNATTQFICNVHVGDSKFATWKCVITDAASQISAPIFVDVNAEELSFF